MKKTPAKIMKHPITLFILKSKQKLMGVASVFYQSSLSEAQKRMNYLKRNSVFNGSKRSAYVLLACAISQLATRKFPSLKNQHGKEHVIREFKSGTW